MEKNDDKHGDTHLLRPETADIGQFYVFDVQSHFIEGLGIRFISCMKTHAKQRLAMT